MVLKRNEDGSYSSRVKNIPDVISIKLNEEEKDKLAFAMELFEQPKHATAIKHLAFDIAAKVLKDDLIGKVITTIFDNKRKNKRLGYDAEFE